MAGHPAKRADLVRLANLYPDDAQEIWDSISQGISLRDTAVALGYTYAALSEWCNHPDRKEYLITARARSASRFAEQTIEIADNGADSSAPDPARDKLRIQSRQWLASRWDRTTYGESRGPSVEVNIGSMFIDAMRKAQPVDTAPVAIIEAKQDSSDIVT